ncbi:MAG: VWA-like domain-containing protein, partial [Candidatus Thermoplasmatota archaeon]|nr:VWA-like domain-containing protein [Candidatus Thermoplasmatota archaeon]
LKHEFYHLVFEHVTGRLPSEGMTKMWNIATDLAINSHLMDELPEQGCFPSRKPFEKYPVGQSAEFYFKMLKEDEQFQKPEDGEDGDGQGQGEPSDGQGSGGSGLPDTMDDHSGWGGESDMDEETKQAMRDIAKERLKQAMKDAVDEINSSGRGWGTIGADTRKAIQDFITPKVDWRKVLRYFIKTSQRSNKRSTPRRINKRFPYIHSGKRVTRQAKIAISIDQSGSVSDAMLALFFSELSSLAKYAEFTIIPFDTEVDPDKVWVWKKGKKHTFERVLCGGTNFDAPTQYVNERDFDGHIVLTDMEAPKPKPSKCQRMWATTPQYAENPYFTTNERMLVMEP